MTSPDQSSLLDELRSLTSCEVSDALISLGIRHGGLITDMNMYSPSDQGSSKLVGPIYTVQMVIANDTTSPKPERHFVDACPPGHIILIQAPPGLKSACWGGLMSTAAKVKGILGVVVDGGIRDILEHRELSFPVHARYHSTLGQNTFVRPSRLNETLTIYPLAPLSDPPLESILITPGDFLICDIDGCVVVPEDRAGEVVDLAKKLKVIDENVRADMIAGKGVQESMKKWRG